MRDLISEIFESIRRNKLRTALTGFAVAWGIFMLIVLLGAGNGLMNSFNAGAGNFASNTMMVGTGWTSKPYDGLKAGRRIEMDDKDIALTLSPIFADHVDKVTATVGLNVTASLGTHHMTAYLEGNYPGRAEMDKFKMLGGRFINEKDIADRRKVVVLPDKVAEKFLRTGETPVSIIGQKIKLDNFIFTVVGVTKGDGMNSSEIMYAPFNTVKTVFNRGKAIDDLTFSFHGLETEEENEEFEKTFRAAVNLRHRAAPDDTRAIWIWNRFTQNLQMMKGTGILSIALWVIGLFTLLSGIVGVSNIMLITVKERTHEFGIRKAIGASPSGIMKLIISESVVITAFFGYIGMFLGLLACELLDKTLGQQSVDVMGEEIQMLLNPTVGLDVAVEATLVLIVAGTLAGIFPARKASKVRPIEALRAE